jgi:hypothetical protein
MVAAIGTGEVFSKGRDFGAWLGLVPDAMAGTGAPLQAATAGKPEVKIA